MRNFWIGLTRISLKLMLKTNLEVSMLLFQDKRWNCTMFLIIGRNMPPWFQIFELSVPCKIWLNMLMLTLSPTCTLMSLPRNDPDLLEVSPFPLKSNAVVNNFIFQESLIKQLILLLFWELIKPKRKKKKNSWKICKICLQISSKMANCLKKNPWIWACTWWILKFLLSEVIRVAISGKKLWILCQHTPLLIRRSQHFLLINSSWF